MPENNDTRFSQRRDLRNDKRTIAGRTEPRRWCGQGFFPFRLEVLTPVFIGSGDDLSPLEYVLREEKNGWRLHSIDLQSWLMEHAADTAVQNIIASGDLNRIYRMLDEKVDTGRFSVFSSRIDDPSLAEELKRAYTGNQTRQSGQKGKTGEVRAALRNPADGCLYIPGSSLKGAISTPLINWLDKPGASSLRSDMEKDPKRGVTNRLREMFGSIGEHAMQALKVSDVSASPSAGAVVRALERSKTPGKQGTPKPPCEIILPGEDALWGRLFMDCPKKAVITLPDGQSVPFRELVRLCNAFYTKRFTEELEKFYKLPHFKDVHAALQPVVSRVQALDENSMLLRVGHYSHVESVTVENNKPFTRMGKNGTPMPWGTTRTLAGGKLPFGWIILHFCSREEYEHGLRQSEEARMTAAAKQREDAEERRRVAAERAAYAVQLRRQQEERHQAEEQKKAEERARQEELARCMAELSPEEALILKLKTAPDEALSMELFREMEGWTPELQKKAAEALCGCWQTLGKWDGKQSKKQEAKIKRVKQLL
ncbi:RAMP superfamily CRISPR-associated protein [uncultured Mailhella sp.]|uniref:RAMP superfamily CRISPR-associated protein n=1 Tax=uncultured Mailhella sp. TaxID=1981031 RepID=UPI002604233F|nr:RAMP superfamily CRISPR-associated protein [uncultured Mailhella sp.]